MLTGDWVDAIAAWLVSLAAAGRRPPTLNLRGYQLRRVAAGVAPAGPWTVSGEQLVAWLGVQAWDRETRRSFRSALRGFYGWALECGLVDIDPSLSVPAVKPTEPCPRPAPEDAYRAALARGDDRTRLMLRLAAELGLRRGEVAQLHGTDVERELSGWALLVHGKGGKLRRVPLSDALAAVIRRVAIAGGGYVFPGRVAGHLSAHYVGKLVSRALPGAWAMHSLRHRFATAAYALDRDVFTVQQLLGHSSAETTRRYVKVPSDSLRRTVLAVAAL